MEEKKTRGRPTLYSDELVAKFCERIASGRSMMSVCQDPDMPDKSSIFLWMSKHEGFSDKYARACEERADYLAEEAVAIADDDSTEPGKVQRDRLRVDTRKWFVAKIHPKKYSERIQQEDITAKPKQLVIVKAEG